MFPKPAPNDHHGLALLNDPEIGIGGNNNGMLVLEAAAAAGEKEKADEDCG